MESKTEPENSGSGDGASASDASADVRRPVSLEDEAALDAFVADADAAVVEFYTDGCGICASMEPVLGNVARELDLAVATVNPRDDPPLVERFDVRSVPLFVLFVDGEPVARRAEGFIPGDDLSEWIEDNVA
ncbi:thioredoxin family protein [Halorubrum kocurii]|uniref:Thioredoxin n=1 Tax=Halorubrum kocurii JCM 14978 TaxID=1230456 RepID=M0P9L1_9EURY|nr:thioredoxin family protein [Halorubrum kocurii]EMA66731.1 thioredoxin [Halorubrum kocurii JCM 14978]